MLSNTVMFLLQTLGLENYFTFRISYAGNLMSCVNEKVEVRCEAEITKIYVFNDTFRLTFPVNVFIELCHKSKR